MLDWLSANATFMQAGVSVVTALVWVIYLQLFLLSYMRQRRPEILISRGAGLGLDSRCFIANLGLEPIYISELLMSIWAADTRCDAAITDGEASTDDDEHDPRPTTNQGPLKSGDSYDAGSFRDMIRRVLRSGGLPEDTRVEQLEVMVVAVHAATATYFGASRRYDVIHRDDGADLVPISLQTRQLRSFLERRRLRARLERNLSWYRS